MSILTNVFGSIRQCTFSNSEIMFSGRAIRYMSGVPITARMKAFRKKLEEAAPFGKLSEPLEEPEQEQEENPLKPWPNNTNPHTGEIGGPKGPEPTRYGDWERNGRVSDF